MKIQCNVCEAAEADVLCCADEAALCWACDQKVHAANKLAGKHQRVPLATSSSQMPKCDICQETVGYFFCLEDRALLCRKCDVSIHTANPFVSAHQRFLLTGVQVGLEPTEAGGSSSSGKSHSNDKMSEQENHTQSMRAAPDMSNGYNRVPSQVTGGSASGSIAQWQFDEFIGLNDFNQGYNFLGNGSSKDCGNLGDSDSSPILKTAEEELDGDESLGQVPEMPSHPRPRGSVGRSHMRIQPTRLSLCPISKTSHKISLRVLLSKGEGDSNVFGLDSPLA